MSGSKTDGASIAAGLGMSAIFGFSFLFTRLALHWLTPAILLGLRFALAALVLAVLALTGAIKIRLGGRPWWRLLPLAAFQPVLYFLCETTGVKLTSASESGIIIGSIPVVVAIMAALFLGERPTLSQGLFIVASAAGVAIMAAGGGGSGGNHLGGVLLLLGAVLAASAYSVLSRKLSSQFSPIEITLVMMWAGAITFNTLALIAPGQAGAWPSAAVWSRPEVWGSLLYLGILSSVGAFFLINFMLSRQEAAKTVAYTNLTSLISVLAGVLILGEVFRPSQWAGGALIILGVWGTNRFARGRREIIATPGD